MKSFKIKKNKKGRNVFKFLNFNFREFMKCKILNYFNFVILKENNF